MTFWQASNPHRFWLPYTCWIPFRHHMLLICIECLMCIVQNCSVFYQSLWKREFEPLVPPWLTWSLIQDLDTLCFFHRFRFRWRRGWGWGFREEKKTNFYINSKAASGFLSQLFIKQLELSSVHELKTGRPQLWEQGRTEVGGSVDEKIERCKRRLALSAEAGTSNKRSVHSRPWASDDVIQRKGAVRLKGWVGRGALNIIDRSG